MLEEQIAEKERQRQDARSQRRGEGGDVQNPMAPLQGRSPAVQPVRQAIGTLGLGMEGFMAQHWPRKCGDGREIRLPIDQFDRF